MRLVAVSSANRLWSLMECARFVRVLGIVGGGSHSLGADVGADGEDADRQIVSLLVCIKEVRRTFETRITPFAVKLRVKEEWWNASSGGGGGDGPATHNPQHCEVGDDLAYRREWRGSRPGGLDRGIAHALPPSRLVKNPRDMLPRVLRPPNFNTLSAIAEYGAQHCQSLSPRARD